MCLSTITKRHDPPLGERWAWKVYERREDGGLSPYLYAPPDGLERGKWMRCGSAEAEASAGRRYRAGFHAIKTRREAMAWAKAATDRYSPHVAVHVRIRGIHTEGTDINENGIEAAILVADELFIPSERAVRERKAAIRKRKASR